MVAMFKNVEQDEDDDYIHIKPTVDNSLDTIKVDTNLQISFVYFYLINICI